MTQSFCCLHRTTSWCELFYDEMNDVTTVRWRHYSFTLVHTQFNEKTLSLTSLTKLEGISSVQPKFIQIKVCGKEFVVTRSQIHWAKRLKGNCSLQVNAHCNRTLEHFCQWFGAKESAHCSFYSSSTWAEPSVNSWTKQGLHLRMKYTHFPTWHCSQLAQCILSLFRE